MFFVFVFLHAIFTCPSGKTMGMRAHCAGNGFPLKCREEWWCISGCGAANCPVARMLAMRHVVCCRRGSCLARVCRLMSGRGFSGCAVRIAGWFLPVAMAGWCFSGCGMIEWYFWLFHDSFLSSISAFRGKKMLFFLFWYNKAGFPAFCVSDVDAEGYQCCRVWRASRDIFSMHFTLECNSVLN